MKTGNQAQALYILVFIFRTLYGAVCGWVIYHVIFLTYKWQLIYISSACRNRMFRGRVVCVCTAYSCTTPYINGYIWCFVNEEHHFFGVWHLLNACRTAVATSYVGIFITSCRHLHKHRRWDVNIIYIAYLSPASCLYIASSVSMIFFCKMLSDVRYAILLHRLCLLACNIPP